MFDKKKLRKKYLSIRKKNYYQIEKVFFNPLINFLKKKKLNSIYLSIFYPSNFEIDVLKFLQTKKSKNIKILLPVIKKKNEMKFFRWNNLDPLRLNKYGILEPIICKKELIPNIMLLPLLAYDNEKYRLGYGKGYFDKYLNKYIKKNKNIITIGVAFSFQKYHKLPFSKFDMKLNYILTDKGMS